MLLFGPRELEYVKRKMDGVAVIVRFMCCVSDNMISRQETKDRD